MLAAVLVALAVVIATLLWFRSPKSSKASSAPAVAAASTPVAAKASTHPPATVRILFASTTGKTAGAGCMCMVHFAGVASALP